MTARLVRGTDITAKQRAAVLRAFVYRNTVEHRCVTAGPRGTLTDAEWIDSHAFYITKRGTIAQIPKHCEPAFLAD